MAANGWRPIIGAGYEKRGPQHVQEASNNVPQVIENNINTKNKQAIRNKNNPNSNRPENYQISSNNHQFHSESIGVNPNQPSRLENYQINSNNHHFRPENGGIHSNRQENLGINSNNQHFRPENPPKRPDNLEANSNNYQFRQENGGNPPKRQENVGINSNNQQFRQENLGNSPKRPENVGTLSGNQQFRQDNHPNRPESFGNHVRQESSVSNGHHRQENGPNVMSSGNLQYLGDGVKSKHHLTENGQNRGKETIKGQGSSSNYVKSNPGHIRVNHHGKFLVIHKN